MLINLLVAGAGAFVVLCALLYWRQDNLIFFPRANDALLLQQLQANRVEIRIPEGRLEGWWAHNPKADSQRVILYFGGNAEDVLYTASMAPLFDAQRLLVVNYRGYGRSSGKPSQKALYDDGLAIYEYVVKSGVSPDDIVVMGRSLGSGVAAMLAGSRPVGGAILITPFDSLAAVAAGHYPAFPVRWLLRHPFRSVDWAKQTNAPALIIAGAQDTIVPAVHAQRLHDAWTGAKQMHTLDGFGHNDIEQHPQYYRLINEFLSGLR